MTVGLEGGLRAGLGGAGRERRGRGAGESSIMVADVSKSTAFCGCLVEELRTNVTVLSWISAVGSVALRDRRETDGTGPVRGVPSGGEGHRTIPLKRGGAGCVCDAVMICDGFTRIGALLILV